MSALAQRGWLGGGAADEVGALVACSADGSAALWSLRLGGRDGIDAVRCGGVRPPLPRGVGCGGVGCVRCAVGGAAPLVAMLGTADAAAADGDAPGSMLVVLEVESSLPKPSVEAVVEVAPSGGGGTSVCCAWQPPSASGAPVVAVGAGAAVLLYGARRRHRLHCRHAPWTLLGLTRAPAGTECSALAWTASGGLLAAAGPHVFAFPAAAHAARAEDAPAVAASAVGRRPPPWHPSLLLERLLAGDDGWVVAMLVRLVTHASSSAAAASAPLLPPPLDEMSRR